jgi:hypothetical protein
MDATVMMNTTTTPEVATVDDGMVEMTAGTEVLETGPEAEEAAAGKLDGIAPEIQAKIDKRIAKLTARAKTAEERLAEAQKRIELLDETERKAEEAKFASLGVHPEFIEPEERQTIQATQSELQEARRAADFWEGREEYIDSASGKTYDTAACRRFALEARKAEGRAEGKLDAVLERAKARMREGVKAALELKKSRSAVVTPKPAASKPKADDSVSTITAPAIPPDATRSTIAGAPPKTQTEAKAFWTD